MAYNDVILADGPELFWDLNEASGTTVTDSSGNGNHGKRYNNQAVSAAAVLPGWASLVEGEVSPQRSNFFLGSWNPAGTVQAYPGSGLKADAYAPFEEGSQRTFEAILTKTEEASFATIFAGSGSGATTADTYHPTWEMGANGMMRYYPNVATFPTGWVDWGTDNTDHPWSDFELNTATMIHCTYDDATGLAEFFVNGNSHGVQGPLGFFGTPLAYNTVGDPGVLQIGWRGSYSTPNTECYGGFMDKIAVYERILTREEIRAHREAFRSYPAAPDNRPPLAVQQPDQGPVPGRTDIVEA